MRACGCASRWRSGPCCRKRDRELRTTFGPILRAHVSAVQLDEVLHDCEAEPGAARIARARLVDAIEPLEHPRQVFFGNPRPPIGDGNFDAMVDAAPVDRDSSPPR